MIPAGLWGPLVTLCIFLSGQLALLVIWGAQLEIRMRNVEKICSTIGGLGTDVEVLKGKMDDLKDSVKDGNHKLDTLLEHRSFRTSRARAKPKPKPKPANA